MAAADLAGLDAVTLARLVQGREVSPVETTAAAIAAMERLDPVLRAFCVPAIEQARAMALSLEARLARGEAVGPLAGVPIAIKDLVLTKDLERGQTELDLVAVAVSVGVGLLLLASGLRYFRATERSFAEVI